MIWVVAFCTAIPSTLPVVRFVRGLILQNDVADLAEERIVQLVLVVHVLPEELVTSKALTTVVTLSFLHKTYSNLSILIHTTTFPVVLFIFL